MTDGGAETGGSAAGGGDEWPRPRRALVVATGTYDDPKLAQLRTPGTDAERLAAALSDPAIGDFSVRTLIDRPSYELAAEIEGFFGEARRDDVLLLHVACHGVKSLGGELHFATRNTLLNRLAATTVSAQFVNDQMNKSRSRRIVLLLDCCYAGAFEHGLISRGGGDLGLAERLGGQGRAVITASSALEYAFENGELAEEPDARESHFTGALVRGLETGEADRDQDGLVSLDELYEYTYEQVVTQGKGQTPGKWEFGLQGTLYIARRRVPVTRAAPLESEVEDALAHPLPAVRASVVPLLGAMVVGRHQGRALAARQALEGLLTDDSSAVRSAAAAALGTTVTEPAPAVSPPPAVAPVPPAQGSQVSEPDDAAGESSPERPVEQPIVGPVPARSSERTRARWVALGAGGLVAALAATVWLWPTDGDPPGSDDGSGSGGTGTEPAWAPLTPPVAQALDAPGVTEHQGEIWVVGGAGSRESYSYDPTTGEWQTEAPLPREVHHTSLVSDGTSLLLIGGLDEDNQGLDSVYRLTDDGAGWVEGPLLPEPRFSGAAAWDGDRVVFGGGAPALSADVNRVAASDVWTLQDDEWVDLGQPLTRAREHLAAATDGAGTVWFLGGAEVASGSLFAAVDVVNGSSVTAGPPLEAPRRQGMAAMWTPDTGPCAFGGSTALPSVPKVRVATVECPDAADRHPWPPLPEATYQAGAVALGTTVYVVGGTTDGLEPVWFQLRVE